MLRRCMSAISSSGLREAYARLGVSAEAPIKEVKQKYYQLVSSLRSLFVSFSLSALSPMAPVCSYFSLSHASQCLPALCLSSSSS